MHMQMMDMLAAAAVHNNRKDEFTQAVKDAGLSFFYVRTHSEENRSEKLPSPKCSALNAD